VVKPVSGKFSMLRDGIILSRFCALLSHEVEEKVIMANPAVKLGKFYKQAKVMHEEIQPLTREEVPIFLQTVLERSKDYYPVFRRPSTPACVSAN
jgi:hypothetical protein